MLVRMQILTDAGEVVHEDLQRVQVGFDLICELGQPIVRYTPQGTHRIFGFTLKFVDHVEPRTTEPA